MESLFIPPFFFPFYRQRDRDKDGKLNFQEYFNGLFDSIRDFNEHVHNASSDGSSELLAKKLFSEIDHDNDGYGLVRVYNAR